MLRPSFACSTMMRSTVGFMLVGFTLLAGCEEKKPAPIAETSATAEEEEAPPPRPVGPPELVIAADSPKVGYTYVLFNKPDGRKRLTEAIAEHKQHIEGKDVELKVDRKAKLAWVTAYVDELAAAGAIGITIRTETRKEFPDTLKIAAQAQVKDKLAPCTVVMVVLEDRGTAVWKISGGTAGKRSKGFAGPDLSMTADTIERYAKGCAASKTMAFSGHESVEWGLIYDLAASAQRIEGIGWDRRVLLSEPPVAGHPVQLGS